MSSTLLMILQDCVKKWKSGQVEQGGSLYKDISGTSRSLLLCKATQMFEHLDSAPKLL